MKYLLFIALAVIVFLGWVRLAPSDPDRWHRIDITVKDEDFGNGAARLVEARDETLEQLDSIIRGTPHTRVLRGSIEEGMNTYVTRTRVFGFPDFTTVRQTGARVEIYGRARFGLSDMGVNAARIDGWLGVLAP